jgi:hypothetical protein
VEKQISSYVNGNLRIGYERVFTSTKMGGLGLFRVSTFLTAQRCSWFGRAIAMDELWKMDLFSPAPGDHFSLRKNNAYNDPILQTIGESYDDLMVNFTKKDNYKKSYILDNEAFTLGIRKKQVLTIDKFDPVGENAIKKIYGLTFSDISTPLGIKSVAELEQLCDSRINGPLYRELSGLVQAGLTKYGGAGVVGMSLKTFFGTLKKGSKPIRKYLEQKKGDYIPHNIVKFSENTEIIIGSETSKVLNASWLAHFFSNELRTFQFKLINNILGLNYIISHFVPGIDRNCTLCDVAENPDPEDETPLHLFFSCNITESLLSDFFNILGTVLTRQEFFCIPTRRNRDQNYTIFWATILFRKYIWDCKMRRCIPTLDMLLTYMYREFNVMIGVSDMVKNTVKNCELSYLFRSGCLGREI